jgi:hypothetical protein
MKFSVRLLCLVVLAAGLLLQPTPSPAQSPPAWPRPIPCRIQDSANPDLFVMTLGDVQTPLAQGIFDPVKDEVTLNDGSQKPHYYRDVLGVKFYAPLDKSIFPLPPAGWCTWYYYYNRITQDEARQNTDWIAANLKDYGAQVVQIDDGWQGTGTRESGRDWTHVNPQHFPDGMANLAAYIKSRGLTPGLWIAPHGQSSPQVVSNNPNVFLRRPNGSYDTNPQRWEGLYLVDPSTPDSVQYMTDLFKKLAGWGYEYFKIDGQPDVAGEYRDKKSALRNHDSTDTDLLYRNTLMGIRKAIGPNRYLLGCWGIPLEGAGIMNGSRTGGDIVLGWDGFQVALRPTLQYYYLHNIVWYGDPDVLVVRSPLTMDQARVWATLEGLTGQGLMSSDRLMDLSPDRVELMRRVYPPADIRPLDLFPTDRYKRIWDLKINHLGRNYDVVGVFNFETDKADSVRLDWKELGLPAGRRVQVFDFWNQEYLGEWADGMVVDTAPTSCRVLTLLPATNRVQLISTSRHITQGAIDLTSLNENAAGDDFQGTSKVVKNDLYELRFAFPRGTNYVVKKAVARAGIWNVPVEIFNHQGWAAVRLTSPTTEAVSWDVQFAPGGYYHYPPSDPTGLTVRRVGLDGVNLSWQEQYYLNAGYQVYLNGQPVGYTPNAQFPIRGLNPMANYSVVVKTVAEDGQESPRGVRTSVHLESLAPATLSLAELEPLRSTGRWRGYEVDEKLAPGTLIIAGKNFDKGLASFANSEAEFDLQGLYNKFNAFAGLDASGSENASAEFIVVADGKELWRSGQMKIGDEAKPVQLNINGVRRLLLRTTGTATTGRRTRTQTDWAEPTVSK